MTNKLWKELSDNQSEKLAGGASVVSSSTGFFFDENQDGIFDANDVIWLLRQNNTNPDSIPLKISGAQVKDPAKHSSIVVTIYTDFPDPRYPAEPVKIYGYFSFDYTTNQQGVRRLV